MDDAVNLADKLQEISVNLFIIVLLIALSFVALGLSYALVMWAIGGNCG